MMDHHFTKVEEKFFKESNLKSLNTYTPYIVVENFPNLGLLTALRFLEWVSENPEGLISLPTGKTPEYFIVWTVYLLENWDNKKGNKIRERYGLGKLKKPSLKNLKFVQMDEFYPISAKQHSSFCNYVSNFYIKGFSLKSENSLLINSNAIPLAEEKHYSEVFPDYNVDLTLRYRSARNPEEVLRQKSIFLSNIVF